MENITINLINCTKEKTSAIKFYLIKQSVNEIIFNGVQHSNKTQFYTIESTKQMDNNFLKQ